MIKIQSRELGGEMLAAQTEDTAVGRRGRFLQQKEGT